MQLWVTFLHLPSVIKVKSPRLAEEGRGGSVGPCSVLFASSVLTHVGLASSGVPP